MLQKKFYPLNFFTLKIYRIFYKVKIFILIKKFQNFKISMTIPEINLIGLGLLKKSYQATK